MKALWTVFKTGGGGGSAPPPPPDPSIAQERARREAVAISRAYQRRQARYGIGASNVGEATRRPGTTTLTTPGEEATETFRLEQNLSQAQRAADAAPRNRVMNQPEISGDRGSTRWKENPAAVRADENLSQAQQALADMTPEQRARDAAIRRERGIERLVQRRESRIGVSTTLGGRR